MKKFLFIMPVVLFFAFLSGCNGRSKKPETSWLETTTDYYSHYEDKKETLKDDDSVKIPYTVLYGNTITIPVKINEIGLDMIFDTGASSTCITLAEARYLYDKGSLTDDDIVGLKKYQTADGNISIGLRINLRTVSIGDKLLLKDVEALVVENQQAPLLLGQSVMKYFREISIDRENKVVKFFAK